MSARMSTRIGLRAHAVLTARMQNKQRRALMRLHARARAILHARSITCKHARMQAQEEKGSDIALHFTDIRSCQLILNSMGIRASSVGQLGGGVSVCLRTVAGFDWGDREGIVGQQVVQVTCAARTHARTHTRMCACTQAHTRTHARTHANITGMR